MFYTYTLILLIGIMTLATAAYTAAWLLTKPPDTPPPDDPTTLIYCQSCGCRHRKLWMTWDDDKYRCIVCCGDPDHGTILPT